MRWLRHLWARLVWRLRVSPLALPRETKVVVDLRLVVLERAGKAQYLVLTPEGRVAGGTAIPNLLLACAEMGQLADVHPKLTRACHKLEAAWSETYRLAAAGQVPKASAA